FSFVNDIEPVFTRAGCNSGSCHGKAEGQGTLHLSLFGYDPEADYQALTRAALGRRIARTDPGASLLLLKPTAKLPHGGGQRFPGCFRTRGDPPPGRRRRDHGSLRRESRRQPPAGPAARSRRLLLPARRRRDRPPGPGPPPEAAHPPFRARLRRRIPPPRLPGYHRNAAHPGGGTGFPGRARAGTPRAGYGSVGVWGYGGPNAQWPRTFHSHTPILPYPHTSLTAA